MNSLAKGQVRDQRRVDLKLDCVDSIEYTSWEPGQEYKKTFVVKNIATKAQTLRWEPPISPYFEVQFQEPHAKLGPMMIAAINIVFRPMALENYTSSIDFRTPRGHFILQLQGLLPAINLGIPSAIDFSCGPVNEITERMFLMKNTSDIIVTYEWVVEPPFSIHPAKASIQQGKTEMVYCRFQPTKAAAFSTTALCCTYLGVTSKLELRGIGKYSFLAVSTPLLAFGEIVVRTTKELALIVTNISIVPAKFQVKKVENKLCKTDNNFTIIPMSGVIKGNNQLTIKVVFSPITAGTFSVEKFEIHTCQMCRASFACSGTAARPVVKLSTFSLDFGSVEAGGYISRSVLLDNQSVIPVHFQFMADDMKVFEFAQPRGLARPKRAVMVTIHFRPTVIANYYKRVICVIQDHHALYCDLLGTCYKVTLKSPTLMQYHVDQHRELVKTASVELQTVADQEGSHFPSKQSVLANLRPYITASTTSPKLLKKGLTGAEWETHDGAWHAMLEAPEWAEEKSSAPAHSTSPKTPTDEEHKSVTFVPGSNPHHTDKFASGGADLVNTFLNPTPGTSGQGPRHRTSAQQRELAEHLLENVGQGRNVEGLRDENIGPDGIPYKRKSRLDSRYLVFSKTWQRGMEGYRNVYHHEIWDEYYIGRIEYWEPVTIDKQVLDFGLGICMQLSEPQLVHVHNNVQTPITVLWLSPREPKTVEFKGMNQKIPSPNVVMKLDQLETRNSAIFHVVPDKAIIPVGGSCTFSVIFEPRSQNNHYCQYLQLFVWTPSVDRVLPPWSTTVCAAGHSFHMQGQEFLPEYSVSKTRINFPPILKGFSVYQTIILRNHNGTVPLSFSFQLANMLPEFVVKPEQGLIPPSEFQLITFRYDAGEPQQITDNVRCILNHSSVDNLVFILNGSSHVPKLILEKNGVVRFKPTSIGTRATLYFNLSNASAIATEYEWQVPKRLSEIFVIKPITGLLQPGESVNISICFIPQNPKLYYCSIPCRAFAHIEIAFILDNGMAVKNVATRDVNRVLLITNGEGIVDTVQIEPGVVDYGFIVVGFPHKAQVTLRNLSAGSLGYALEINPKNRRSCNISFDRPTGQLHGHAKGKVLVTFHAIKAKQFNFEIVCRTYLPGQEMPQYVDLLPESDPMKYMSYDLNVCSPSGATATSVLTAHAKYPYLVVAAVRSPGLSNSQMWRELQVRKLNCCLSNGKLLTKASGEAIYVDFFGCEHPVNHASPFVLNFGAQLISTNQTIIDLVIKSGNELPVAWRVRLWNDLEVDMENWVMPGEPTEEEQKMMLIRKFNLFHVEPRKGLIQPGEEQFLRFRYVHIMEGKHVLPAIIEVKYGRTLHLNLEGRSIPNPPRILVMDVEQHFLRPTPVGQLNPAYQTVELCNRGPCDIEYEVDISPLEMMVKANFGFRVLWCQNPSGIVPSMDSILLNWLFQPLEPKHYTVTVPIRVREGEGRTLILTGHGIHPQNKLEFSNYWLPPNSPPNIGQTYNWPDLPIILSTELIDFKDVLDLSENHRLVAIQSLAHDCKVQFAWHNSAGIEQNVQGQIQVYPIEGIIEPGKQVLCKVQFIADIQPQLFEATIILSAQRIPLDCDEIMKLSPTTPPIGQEEIFSDTWPPRLEVGVYNKQFMHDCVIERFTTTSELHMTDKIRFKLEHLEENRNFERSKQIEKEALAFSPPPPVFSNLHLTIRSHIRPRVFTCTREDLLSLTTEDRFPFRVADKTMSEVQSELVHGILMELLQEGLHDEMILDSFQSLECEATKTLYFEEFRKPFPPLHPLTKSLDQLERLAEGALPEAPRWLDDQSKPWTPLATTKSSPTSPLRGDVELNALGPSLEDQMRVALSKTPPPIPPKLLQSSCAKRQKDKPSMRAAEMAYSLFEEALFLLVKDIFEDER